METIVVKTYGMDNIQKNKERKILRTTASTFEGNASKEEALVLEYLEALSDVKYHKNKDLIDKLEQIILDEQTQIGINEAEIRNICKHKIKFLLSREQHDRVEYLKDANDTKYSDIRCKKSLLRKLRWYTDEELYKIYVNALENDLGFEKIVSEVNNLGVETIVYQCKDLSEELVLNKINELKNDDDKSVEEPELGE